MIVRPPRQPGPDRRRFMRGIVIHDDVDIETLRDTGVDLLEKVEKLGRAVALVAFTDHEARGDIEGCEQGSGAVTDIAMGPALGNAGHHRQDRLLAVERLDLALLIDAENQRPVGR